MWHYSPHAGYPDAGKFSQAPPSYVLYSPLSGQFFRPVDALEFELVLVGRAIEALPYFIYTFIGLGHGELGIEREKH